MKLCSVTVDTSDRSTSDNMYSWIRTMTKKYKSVITMAGKGSSNDYGHKEIFYKPRVSIDTVNKRNIKASKYGLAPYIIGTHKAKDEMSRRLKLSGCGKDRFHIYKGVTKDYLDQILSEVKPPQVTWI